MNFDKEISKQLALILLKPAFYDGKKTCIAERIGVEVMNKEYGIDSDWIRLTWEDYYTIFEDEEYKTFELWYPIKSDGTYTEKAKRK